jgi:hypothetical protein
VDNRAVAVPVSLLLDPDLPPSWKLLWLAKQLNPAITPAGLAAQTGLSRRTLVRCLGQVTAKRDFPLAPQVKVPRALVVDRRVGAQAKILYGLLRTLPDSHGRQGEFTYASLCEYTHVGRNTLKHAIAELVGAGWAQVSQTNRLSPIRFRLPPFQEQSMAEAIVAERRLKRATYRGEAIMQEYLSLLIDSDQFTENARPGFLVNPQTGERLEFDRFYPPNLAFEFHGAQHDGSTERFSQEEVGAQRLRDLIKAGICYYRSIHLVVIRASDLSVDGILERIAGRMPLRELAGHEALIDLLENASMAYRAASERKTRGKSTAR